MVKHFLVPHLIKKKKKSQSEVRSRETLPTALCHSLYFIQIAPILWALKHFCLEVA